MDHWPCQVIPGLKDLENSLSNQKKGPKNFRVHKGRSIEEESSMVKHEKNKSKCRKFAKNKDSCFQVRKRREKTKSKNRKLLISHQSNSSRTNIFWRQEVAKLRELIRRMSRTILLVGIMIRKRKKMKTRICSREEGMEVKLLNSE